MRGLARMVGVAVALAAFPPTAQAAGRIDPTFRASHHLVWRFGAPIALAPAPGRGLYVATQSGTLVRALADGSRRWRWDLEYRTGVPHSEILRDIASLPDGRVVVLGLNVATNVATLRRLHAGGAPDRTFGAGGLIEIPGVDAHALAVSRSAQVVVAGTLANRSVGAVFVTRLTARGAPDPTFGRGGTYTRTVFEARAVSAVTFRGADVVFAASRGFRTTRLLLGRLRRDGRAAPGFGRTGIRTVGAGQPRGLAVQGNGRIVVSGLALNRTYVEVPAVWRFTARGVRDRTFGTRGRFWSPSGNGAGDIAVQRDGRIVVAQLAASGGPARLTARGRRDRSFSAPSPASADAPPQARPSPWLEREAQFPRLLQDRDGRLSVAGTFVPEDRYDFGESSRVLRYLAGNASATALSARRRAGAALVQLRCAAPRRNRCRGILRLSMVVRRNGRALRVRAGARAFDLRRGADAVRAVRLTAAARRALAARRSTPVRAETTTRDRIGYVDVRRRTLRLGR